MAFDWRYRAGIRIPYGDGALPREHYFRRGISVWQGDGVHANPRFFKVRWKIWTAETAFPSDMDHREMIRQIRAATALSFREAMETAQALRSAGTPMIINSRAYKRIAPDTPWDPARVPPDRRAIPYDEDSDPDFCGHR